MSHISGRLTAQGRPSLTDSQLQRTEVWGWREVQEVNTFFDLLLSARSTVKEQGVCVILFNCTRAASLLLRHTYIFFVTCTSGHKLQPYFGLCCLVQLAYCCRMFLHCSSKRSLSHWLWVSLLMPTTQFSFLSFWTRKEHCITSWVSTGSVIQSCKKT